MDDNNDIKKRLGSAVRLRRKNLGLSQEALAERADLHRTYVTDIERGSRNISVESISKLATALGVSIGSLFPESEPAAGQVYSGSTPGIHESVEIVMVEDDSKDIELTLEAFNRAKITNMVHVLRDGAAALDFLFCRGAYRERSPQNLPQVMLLDLGLPKVHGLEVLRQVREDTRLRDLKVVVLSGSRSDLDVREAFRLGAHSFISKPVDFHNFSDVTPDLNLCWTLRQPALAASGPV